MENFSDLVDTFIGLIALLIPLIFALTLVVVIWKIIDAWIIHAGDPNKIEEGKSVIFAGILALIVMSGIWGILSILQYSLFDYF